MSCPVEGVLTSGVCVPWRASPHQAAAVIVENTFFNIDAMVDEVRYDRFFASVGSGVVERVVSCFVNRIADRPHPSLHTGTHTHACTCIAHVHRPAPVVAVFLSIALTVHRRVCVGLSCCVCACPVDLSRVEAGQGPGAANPLAQ